MSPHTLHGTNDFVGTTPVFESATINCWSEIIKEKKWLNGCPLTLIYSELKNKNLHNQFNAHYSIYDYFVAIIIYCRKNINKYRIM